jgi:hypothetical protein
LSQDYNGDLPGTSRRLEIKKEDFIQNKTTQPPIPTGGRVPGYIAFIFEGVTRENADFPGTRITMEYKDVKGRGYSSRFTVPARAQVFPVVP